MLGAISIIFVLGLCFTKDCVSFHLSDKIRFGLQFEGLNRDMIMLVVNEWTAKSKIV